MSDGFPYQDYLTHPAWKLVARALQDLESNDDLSLQTSQKYVVGHLVKTLVEAGLMPAALPVKLTPAQLKHVSWAWTFNTPSERQDGKRRYAKPLVAAKAG